ncbi:MAG: SusC/RagA family TonB-linked outer membrane protein [Pedobacter sp.]|uniref:SusC/RagA family TonB-linked outer membrane protein n=1 Tax=Pedobacter sp. TaxID=1411316 RepID=UPI003561D76C
MKKEVSLIRLFKEIRKQTGVNVIWNEKEFNVNQKIDVAFRNEELKTVMVKISDKLLITYTILGQNIVLKNKAKAIGPTPIPEKIASTDKKVIENRPREFNLKPVEIVSTGYQHIPKERASGSFVLVDSNQINRKVSKDIFSRLEGITSGLLFNKNTMISSSGSLDFSIRGRSTIYANDQPLIILDDFPFNGDFDGINPNDVANITVLKDAAAASIWGVRAGNGVIVINTKRGKYKQPLKFSFSSTLTVSGKPDVFYNPNYLSSSDFIDIETFLFNNGKYNAALADKVNYPVISPVVQILNKQRNGQSAIETSAQLDALRKNDIRKEELKYFYQKPLLQQHFLSASKGTAKSNHYLSVGYDHNILGLVNNKDKRLTINTQNTVKLLKTLELNLGISYIHNTGTLDSAVIGNTSGSNFTPYYQFKDAKGNSTTFDKLYSSDFNKVALSKGFLDWSYVPLDELQQPPPAFINNDLNLRAGIKYTVLPGFSVEVKSRYQYVDNEVTIIRGLETFSTRDLINRYSIIDNGQVSGYNIPLGATYTGRRRTMDVKNIRGQLNFNKDWNEHAISAIAGYELSQLSTQLDVYNRYGYNTKTGSSVDVDTNRTFPLYPSGTGKITLHQNMFGNLDRIRSAYANLGYTYDNKYTVSGSARIDGSNYFGVKTNQKNIPLWSAGGLWHLDRESFYKLDWLPTLKLRVSYGYNGNLDKRYTGITTFKKIPLLANYTNLPYASIINIGNPELRWEKIGIANFGLDFGFKDQVVSGKIEYYTKRGTDILGDKAFAASTGIKVLRGNYSEMEACGMDLSLNSHNLRGAVKWHSNFMFSIVHDRVTLYEVMDPNNVYYTGNYSSRPLVGKPVFGIYSYEWAGLDPLNGDPRGYLNGEISKNYKGIFEETNIDDLEYNGPARPTIFGALNNSLSFKNFTLAINLTYKFGYFFRKPSVDYYDMYNDILGNNMNNDFGRRWQKPGDENITNIPSMANYSNNDNGRDRFYNGSSATVAKGDHIRLQDISLGYDFDKSNWKGIPVNHLQLFIYANNLGVLWKANDFGLDPDFVPIPSDRFTSPLPRSFSFGVKASF